MRSFFIIVATIMSTFLYSQDNTITGIVFLDGNKDGKYNIGEQLLKGVPISNQKDVVLTDNQGRYSIELRDASFLYVIKPSGYQVSLSNTKIPDNYYFYHPAGAPSYLKYPGVSPTGKPKKNIDFPLYKTNEKKPIKAIIIGDPQAADNERLNFFRDGSVTDMLRQQADLYLILGDIADDYLDIYPREKSIMGTLGMPGYHVPGNHDINYNSKYTTNHFETFKKEYGPDYYSFNYNKTHFIVLNNINYFGWNEKDNKRGDYFGGLGEVQLQWLKNDLNIIPKGNLVVISSHIPFLEKFTEKATLSKLEQILTGRKVLLLSGHTHAIQTYKDAKNLNEGVIAGAACGSWWTEPKDEEGIPVATSMDGSPKGYFIFEFLENKYSYKFIPANHPEDYQIRISIPLEKDSPFITANWFIGKTHEKVIAVIDDSKPLVMTNYAGVDPFMQRTVALRKNKDNWSPGLPKTEHLWRLEIPKDLTKGIHKIEITAQTDSGIVYKGYKIFEID